MGYTTKHILVSLGLGSFLSIVTVYIGLGMGWIEEVNLLELFAVATSYTCTYLCVMQVRWQYVFAAVTTIAYTVLFFQWGLYGSAIASLYVPFALVYGWYRWGKDSNPRRVSLTKPFYYPAYITLGITGWAVTYLIAQVILGFPIPWMDSAILVLTIMAQFLMDNKKLENWIVWGVLNVIAIILYFNTGLYLAAMQYVLFLVNTAFGYVMWYRSMHPKVEPYYAMEEGVDYHYEATGFPIK